MKRLLCLALGALLLQSCTVIRYVDPNDPDGGNGNAPARKVDLLIQMDMSRPTANLAQGLSGIVGAFIGGLEAQNIEVRKAALAPAYRRAEGSVPLLYGLYDESNEFSNWGEALLFYTYDSGASYLIDSSTAEGENLASLGLSLDQTSIYKPTQADPDARAYFEPPADGFIVLMLASAPRRCGVDDPDCELNGVDPAEYFTKTDANGDAAWLDFPGDAGLPPSKVFHVAVATEEGVDYEEFYDNCTGFPNFPLTAIDVVQPSPDVYYSKLMERITDRGGNGASVDLCEALSSQADLALGRAIAPIRLNL